MKRTFLAVVTALLTVSALSSHASIVWVGTTSSDVFDESNWDLSGSLVTTIDENVSIEDDVFIGGGAVFECARDSRPCWTGAFSTGGCEDVDAGRRFARCCGK